MTERRAQPARGAWHPKGALDSLLVWLPYAALTSTAAAVLGWCWPALSPGTGSARGLVTTSCLLLGVMVMAGLAVT